ncbi:toll-like receptor 4 [Ostrea edulis]|uniref:toll-like receptor 4 n=1 Tax=Ostrea edulis TaxID=37623 RepID=UPI0024AF0B9A|nr:toll-like receptor 4 [Ostrea edulis]
MEFYCRYYLLYIFLLLISYAVAENIWHLCVFGVVNCTCENIQHQIKVDCSKKHVQNIPHFPKNVSWIDLSDNDIEEISDPFPETVSYIDLSRNKIKSLSNKPFRGLRNLKSLNLEGNKISISELYQGLFADLYSLTELSLKGNSHPGTSVIVHDEVFAELKSLQILKIDGPKNISFGKGFSNLANLYKLDLSGITGNCSFTRIPQDMFNNTPKLKYVDVSACNIIDIEEGAFGVLPLLQYLDVSHNKRLGFASLPNITHNLNQTSIDILHINGIMCLTGTGSKILRHHLINIDNTNLTEIHIEKNRLEQLEPGVIRNFPKTIRIFSMGENKLTQGRYIIDYFFLANLRVLNISVQLRPPPYPSSIFEDCKEKTDEYDYTRTNPFEERTHVTIKDFYTIRETSMQDSDSKSERKRIFTFYLPRFLETLYANASRLYTKIPEFGINGSSLREIYVQNNFFYSWNGPVHGAEGIQILDLSNNFCFYISPHFLKYGTGLKSLNLSENNIGQSLSSDKEGKTFENLISLENLDLSHDSIMSLSVQMFKNMRKLKTLNLKNNLLSIWRVNIEHLREIKYMNLAQNRFTTIEERYRRSFETLFRTSNLTVDLSGNKLLCSCDNVDFLSWITRNRRNFARFIDYECSSTSSEKFNFTNAAHSLVSLKEICKSYLVIYIATSVTLAFIFSTVVGITLQKNKWKIRYVVFKAKQRFKKLGRYSNEFSSSSIHYKYDAMISYSRSELSFMLTEFIPRVENNSNIQLYIRDRDEPAGVAKGQVIMDAIQDSKRVICLISKRYLKSKWRDYELNMARMEAIEARENLKFVQLVIFPEVYNGHLPKCITDLELCKCVHEYPEEACAYDDFWETLKTVIEEDL